MFLISVSPIMISAFKKVHLFKTKSIKTAEKESSKWVRVMVGSVLFYILGCEACELHFLAMRLYFKYHCIYLKLTGSLIRAFVFHCYAEAFLGVFVLVIIKYGKKALLQNSINRSSGHLIELCN